ncbi:hypothetical protein PybrP1_010276 [[Pythium] brassicae (nom. inval.)]|nr:hypothetical protein PybrP1_010276 [[Pythium] brassicae (nom. inval.)]
MGGGASTAHDSATTTTVKRAVFVCHSSQEPELRRRLAMGAWRAGESSSSSSPTPTPTPAVAVVTERYPRDTQARAELLALAQVAVLAVDAAFQQAPALVAAVSFLKDCRKDVVAGPLPFHSRPSGAVGAICFAFGSWMPEFFLTPPHGSGGWQEATSAAAALSFLSQDEAAAVVAAASASDSELDAIAASEYDAFQHAAAVGSEPDASTRRLLFVFAGDDGERVAGAFAALAYDSATTAVECCAQTLERDLASLARAHVAAFVITDACMGTERPSARYFRRLLEAAIRWRTPVVPINAATMRMSDGGGWLALAMAGKLWYQVVRDALEQIHTRYADIPDCACKVEDSCLASDFLQCLGGLLASSSSILSASADARDSADDGSEREAALIASCREKARVGGGLSAERVDSLCAAVHELVASHDTNPDSATPQRQQLEALGVAMEPRAFAQQVADEEHDARALTPSPSQLLPAAPDSEQLSVTTVHYTVTRGGLQPVPSVLDARGVPLVNLQLDAMFSYQWGAQQAVLDVHQQGHVHRLRAWLDVFGHMQGNVNAAMATAVENVACVVVFLTRAYVRSVNCRLEFQYARARGTPLLFAFLEDPRALAVELPDWVLDAVGARRPFSVLPTLCRGGNDDGDSRVLALDLTTSDQLRGASPLAVLFSAVRQLAAARHRGAPRTAYDGSLLLYATTRALRHAVLQQQQQQQQQERADTSSSRRTCTRCSAAFDPAIPASVDGCRRHAAYFLGGSLLAGRWVCCEEQQRDGAGCEPAQHTAAPRAWTLDPSYGTYSWQPE